MSLLVSAQSFWREWEKFIRCYTQPRGAVLYGSCWRSILWTLQRSLSQLQPILSVSYLDYLYRHSTNVLFWDSWLSSCHNRVWIFSREWAMRWEDTSMLAIAGNHHTRWTIWSLKGPWASPLGSLDNYRLTRLAEVAVGWMIQPIENVRPKRHKLHKR